MQTQLLRLPAVLARVPMSRAGLYAKISAGSFPKPVKIGERAVAWRATDIDKWAESLGETYTLADIKAAVLRPAAKP